MLRILWRIVRYALRHKLLVTVAYGAMAGSIVALLVIPRLVGSAIDTALEGGSRTDLLLQAGAIVAMAAVQGILRYIDEYTSEIVVQPGRPGDPDRHIPEAPEPQLRLPRQAAHRRPDVQGDGGRGLGQGLPDMGAGRVRLHGHPGGHGLGADADNEHHAGPGDHWASWRSSYGGRPPMCL